MRNTEKSKKKPSLEDRVDGLCKSIDKMFSRMSDKMDRLEKRLDVLTSEDADDSGEGIAKRAPDHTYSNTRAGCIEEIIDNFDFQKMARVMNSLGWKWYKHEGEFTADQLADEANKQLWNAFEYLDDKEYDYYGWRENNTGCGGFDIWVCEHKSGGRFAHLKFVVEDWRVEPAADLAVEHAYPKDYCDNISIRRDK